MFFTRCFFKNGAFWPMPLPTAGIDFEGLGAQGRSLGPKPWFSLCFHLILMDFGKGTPLGSSKGTPLGFPKRLLRLSHRSSLSSPKGTHSLGLSEGYSLGLSQGSSLGFSQSAPLDSPKAYSLGPPKGLSKRYPLGPL